MAKVSPLVGKKGTIPVDLLVAPTIAQPWNKQSGNFITPGGKKVKDPTDKTGRRKIPDPFDIKVNAAGLKARQMGLITIAQGVLGKASDNGKPAYVFGGEGAQHGGKLLPQLLIDAGNAGFDVMQPSGNPNHIDFARCADDAAYAAWVRAVHKAANIPLLSGSVHMDAYLFLATIYDNRARDIARPPGDLTDEQIQKMLQYRMAKVIIGAARLGVRVLHLFWGQAGQVPPYGWPFHEEDGKNIQRMRQRTADLLRPLVELAAKLGIYLCHEIHFGTIAMNAEDMIAIWELLGRPWNFVLGFDPSHFWHGETWVQALDKLRKAGIRVIVCHFKQTILVPGRPQLSYQSDDRLRGMMFSRLNASSGIVDMNLYAGQLLLPGTGLAEFWHGECDLPIPGYAEAEDPHWNTWDVLVDGVQFLQTNFGNLRAAGKHFTAEMAS